MDCGEDELLVSAACAFAFDRYGRFTGQDVDRFRVGDFAGDFCGFDATFAFQVCVENYWFQAFFLDDFCDSVGCGFVVCEDF